MGRLLDKGPVDEIETAHSKFVISIVDTLKSGKASNEDTLQALRDLGAVIYIGTYTLTLGLKGDDVTTRTRPME